VGFVRSKSWRRREILSQRERYARQKVYARRRVYAKPGGGLWGGYREYVAITARGEVGMEVYKLGKALSERRSWFHLRWISRSIHRLGAGNDSMANQYRGN
jgi:hypothetical protein